MKLRQAANDVMLRINDVALGANGKLHLHPNTKVLVFQGLFVFLGVQNIPLSPLHLFLILLDLNLRLYGGALSLNCSYDIIFFDAIRCVGHFISQNDEKYII